VLTLSFLNMSRTKVVQFGVSLPTFLKTLIPAHYNDKMTRKLPLQASGNLGEPIFKALVASNKFDITVVARTSSNFTAPDPSSEREQVVIFPLLMTSVSHGYQARL
jgi:hypothetical protein